MNETVKNKQSLRKLCMAALFAALCYIIKKSPQWMIPIITANMINLVVDRPEDMLRRIVVNAVVLALLLVLCGCVWQPESNAMPTEPPVTAPPPTVEPAGIYEALRITIGAGEGHNWWCVVFPALCVGATVSEFEETAHCAGMNDSLTGALAGEESYEARFLVLDALGRLENFLHKG